MTSLIVFIELAIRVDLRLIFRIEKALFGRFFVNNLLFEDIQD
tara:strand:- start:605 stop:733 length:129 start_codon:yes stop_codon:yes gene_type:complete